MKVKNNVTVHGFKGSGVQGCFSLSSSSVWRYRRRLPARIRRFRTRDSLSNGRLLPKRSHARFESGRFCPQPGTLNPEPVNAYKITNERQMRMEDVFHSSLFNHTSSLSSVVMKSFIPRSEEDYETICSNSHFGKTATWERLPSPACLWAGWQDVTHTAFWLQAHLILRIPEQAVPC
jgi:hypothetical protein